MNEEKHRDTAEELHKATILELPSASLGSSFF